MEQADELGEHEAQHQAQQQRAEDFQNGIEEDAHHTERPADHGLRRAEGNRKHNQTHGVIQRNHWQQHIGHRAFGLILIDDHHGGGGSGSCGHSAQHQAGGYRQPVAQDKMQRQQRQIDAQAGGQRLQNGHHGGLLSGLPQRGQAELVANGEGDEAQRHVADQAQAGHLLKGGEADPGNMEQAQTVRPDQNTGHQVRSHRRQVPFFNAARGQQTGHQRKGNGQ